MSSTTSSDLTAIPNNLPGYALEYLLDAFQRSILFADVLRQRGNNYLKHKERGQPPILQFDYEMIIDGRKLQRPVNYALLHIKPAPRVPHDPTKRPYVIVDPRAGHGPGIGGSKHESQVGMALRAGHPVYFVSFFPEPEPGQTLRDVAAAEAVFIEEVARRHPEAQGKPCVIGNCQAGWAVAGLAALRPEIMGPVILTGAPLSYWSGGSGQNPMRYSAGLMGGKWLESMACDLGNGMFDGAHLVANFENLDPANTLWKKYYNLYSKIDTEPARFLGFETWWGGYFRMNREEIDAIVSELFIGNKLAEGVRTPDGRELNLRNIRSPIVVFASWGDNITPPQQALNWIEDVYGDEQSIIDNDQVIVYLLHEDVGHLGIFVSGRVAAKEHKELIGTLEMIDALPPGLYEMIIEHKDAAAKRADLEPGEYLVRFEARTMDDIRSLGDERREAEERFQTVDAVSKLNDRFYRLFVSPWVRAMTTAQSAEFLRQAHPLRIQHEWLSDQNPMMALFSWAVEPVQKNRRPAAEDNPFLTMEKMASASIGSALDMYRDMRDTFYERAFRLAYGAAGLGALFPPEPKTRARPASAAPTAALSDEEFEQGGLLAAVLRIVAGAVIRSGVFDRRSALIAKELKERGQFKDVKPQEVRTLFKKQAKLVRRDLDRAINGLAVMLPTMRERRLALEAVRRILLLAPEDIRMDRPLVKRLAEVLELDPRELPKASDKAPA